MRGACPSRPYLRNLREPRNPRCRAGSRWRRNGYLGYSAAANPVRFRYRIGTVQYESDALDTVQGLGGSLSNAAGGAMVLAAGYDAAFALLALFAAVAFILAVCLPSPHAIKVSRIASGVR